MNSKTALTLVFFIGLFGLVFSGVLSYKELFAPTGFSCPSPGAPGTIFGYPACIYGFFMYLLIVSISAIGLFRKND